MQRAFRSIPHLRHIAYRSCCSPFRLLIVSYDSHSKCYSVATNNDVSDDQAPHNPPPFDSNSIPNNSPAASPEDGRLPQSIPPFYFQAGYGLHAKRNSRPFPPPVLSRPAVSFSDPLSTHNQSRDRRKLPTVNGELIRGITNGDDAVLVSERFVCANDGVGAWATREKGHAALWSRLIVHFWALEAEKHAQILQEKDEETSKDVPVEEPNPVAYLESAYEDTKKATSEPTEWHGTTTASGALLSYDNRGDDKVAQPVLYVTQLGDSTVMVVRPRTQEILYKTKEQWHWFDCPRQLGTNSPDTPENNAVMDRVEIEVGDIVLAMSDGVGDNLWDHEIMQNVVDNMNKWDNNDLQVIARAVSDDDYEKERLWYSEKMMFVAEELVKSARIIAEDPFAESPYMEKAIDEGLSIEGGKRDDISVVAALCVERPKT
jgi:hypothetical protein